MTSNLSADDVKRLMSEPSAENRADAAAKIATQFEAGNLSDSERALAEDIFRIMVKDAEERVRAALSSNLKNAPGLDHELAATLAKDVSDEVALPIIQFSEALRDEDLIEIIRTQPEIRQVAVAGRPAVSEEVADTLVDEGAEEAVVTLVGNQNASLSEKTLNKVVDKYGEDDRFQEPLVHRAKLPVTVAERLVSMVSESLQKHLVTHHDLPEEMATDLLMQTREKATISLVSSGADEDDLDALVAQLKANGRLTPSLVLRALCMGDIAFFEVALASMANVPLANARILIHDEGELGLQSVYDKAGLPKALFPAFRTAVRLARGSEEERFDDDPETQMRRMLERVLTVHEDIVEEYGVENVEYLLTKFNKLQHAGMGGSDAA